MKATVQQANLYLSTHKQTVILFSAMIFMLCISIFPDLVYANSGGSSNIGKDIVEEGEKYMKNGIKFAANAVLVVGIILVVVMTFGAYKAWGDDENRKGTIVKLISIFFVGVIIVIFAYFMIGNSMEHMEKEMNLDVSQYAKPTLGNSIT